MERKEVNTCERVMSVLFAEQLLRADTPYLAKKIMPARSPVSRRPYIKQQETTQQPANQPATKPLKQART